MNIKESKRLLNLRVYEDTLYIEGKTYIAGVDEVGRGALAGPIVSAAVILKKDIIGLEGVNDSKTISATNRKKIFDNIILNCISFSTAKLSSSGIDLISLGRANILVMQKAIGFLSVKPDIVLSDAFKIDCEVEVIPLIKGDMISISIAAASIIAKITRDKIMENFDKIYPLYGFKKNKGYGTTLHLANLKKYGCCPIHRKSFNNVKNFQEKIF